tara:strand:+ start:1141 stop:1611 length:471 start_codon:yes stop_codon:yes gene_type:complete
MKYKITEMDTYSMKVEYEDGTWAMIPSIPEQDKNYYLIQIKGYQPKDTQVAVKDHPMKVGDEGVVGEGIEDDPDAQLDLIQEWDYANARAIAYPSSAKQWDAYYWLGKGDDTLHKALIAHIEMVKEKFPKDMKPLSVAEMETAMKELEKDSRWVES